VTRKAKKRDGTAESLRMSEEHLRLALAGADLGAWDWNLVTGDVSFTERCTGMLGYEPDEIEPTPSTFEKLLHPDDVPDTIEALGAHLKGETESYTIEHRMRHKSGKWVWVLNTGRVIDRDAEGRPLRACGTHRDVTKRKQDEEALRKSEERLSNFLQSATDGFMLWSSNLDLVVINHVALGAFPEGTQSRDVIGENIVKLVPGIRETGRYDAYRRVMETGEPFFIEDLVPDPKFGDRHLSVRAFRVGDGLGLVGSDITERKRAEEKLSKSEQRIRSIVETVPEWILTVDREGTITYINRAAPGTTVEDVVGTTVYRHMPPEHRLAFREALERVFTRGEVVELEASITPFGTDLVMWSLNRIGPVFEGGEITSATISSTDITDRRRAEAERLALARQVHAAKLESLSILAGGVAHDFNNLLMTILGNVDLALERLSPMSAARDNLQQIEKASRHAAELANQMLSYSGEGRFVIEPIDAEELIREMGHLLEVSISKKTAIEYSFAENLPSFGGDVTQIRQVIMNLITNASEAIGDEGGVIALRAGAMDCDRADLDEINEVLRVSLDEPLPEGLYTCLEVADTGCGMDAETIERIFDPFFTTKFTGRGLGMSAVLGIVRSHHGALKIHSEVGQGTTVKILFPANHPPADGFATRRKEAAEERDWRGGGTILLADDEESVCTVTRKMLERMGFSVLTAPDGREALNLFREHAGEIVCVLLDLTMPHLDGEEAFDEMQRIHRGVPVVLCSGYTEQNTIQRFASKGLAGFLQKPYNMATLREKLMSVLARGEGER
jgi:two-component system cell cycle sensor histidine kinase/response regulator CckA